MIWYIQLLTAAGAASGDPFTLASVGIEDVQYELGNLTADTWTFTVGGAVIDAAALWPYGQLMAIQDANGNRLAFGRIEPWTRSGTPAAQNHQGRLVNPWWYFTRLIYQQRYTITVANYPNVGQNQGNPVYRTVSTPRVVLNILYDGQHGFYSATTGQQLADAVNWAIAQGAPIQLGTVDPATQPFSDFHKGIPVADVIHMMWKKEPDFVVDWDYSTLPFPTIHFRKAASFVPLTIDLTDTERREQVSIRERPDWQRSYVNISYDQTNNQSGQAFLQISNDLWPNPPPAGTEAAFSGVDLYCDLQGSSANQTSMTCSLASMPVDVTSLNTWQRWKPDLAAPGQGQTANTGTVVSVTILTAFTNPPASPTMPAPALTPRDEYGAAGQALPLDPTCVYEVVDGEWADWLGINGQRCRASAWAYIVLQNGETKYEQLTADVTMISVNTNGIVKTFTQAGNNIQQYSEPVPVGLAQAMWTSWNNLAIEGSFTNVEDVVGTQVITRSNCLNFSTATPGLNGQPDWRNVNARVQRISGSFLHGTTKVEFGAPLRITGNELIDVVRQTRYRTTTIDVAYLFGGLLGGGATNVKFGRKTHARAAHSAQRHTAVSAQSQVPAPGPHDPIIVHDGTVGMSTWTSGSGGQVTVDSRACKGSDGNWHPLSIVEYKICVQIAGALKQRTVLTLASAYYQAPDDPA